MMRAARRLASQAPHAWSPERIGRAAVRALHEEAVLHPKPGLVSAADDGSHRDMSLATFYRSIAALRSYFPAIAALGAAGAPWSSLAARGQAAEAAMLRATGGINTHRGAIFHLGLLCAAAGALAVPTAHAMCAYVRTVYAPHFRNRVTADSHGAIVARRHCVGGARGEAAGGYRAVRRWSLPTFRIVLDATGDSGRAAVHALFALIANIDDTNLLWRGGEAGQAFAKRAAKAFLDQGGALAPEWREHAVGIHRDFVDRGLSPGGCADLLAVTLFLDALDREACPIG